MNDIIFQVLLIICIYAYCLFKITHTHCSCQSKNVPDIMREELSKTIEEADLLEVEKMVMNLEVNMRKWMNEAKQEGRQIIGMSLVISRWDKAPVSLSHVGIDCLNQVVNCFPPPKLLPDVQTMPILRHG
jgi:hypothetical protein